MPHFLGGKLRFFFINEKMAGGFVGEIYLIGHIILNSQEINFSTQNHLENINDV